MVRKILYILLCAIAFQICIINAQKVKLTDVKAITLKKGEMTTGRRGAPVSQLQCHGNLCSHSPDTIQCVNVGSDGSDSQWKCEADLLETLRLHANTVNCEGYEYPTDPYILLGSCSLTYTITGSVSSAHNDNAKGSAFGFIGLLLLLFIFCRGRNNRGYYNGGYSAATTAAAAALGAAAGSSWSGRGYRRGGRSWWAGRGVGSHRSSRSRSTRTSTGFCGTSRR